MSKHASFAAAAIDGPVARHAPTRAALALTVFAGCVLVTPALALDLNSFRAQHGRPPLAPSAQLMGAAYAHANALASRGRLDHKGFRARLGAVASTAAENVAVIACARPDAKPGSTFAGRACDCASEDCAFRAWAKSSGHRSRVYPGSDS